MPSLASVLLPLSAAALAVADVSISLKSYPNAMKLSAGFDPIKAAYWTGLPHHRRTPFAVSPDGQTGYIAYLDESGTGVHVQHIDPKTMTWKGPDVTLPGLKEAGGIVAHDHGFALLGNEAIPTSVQNAPPGNTPVPAIYRWKNGKQVWKTFVAGPGVHADDGLSMAPDMNGDLVWSEKAQRYGAYFVVTDYEGWAEGHFGDSIQYVKPDGSLDSTNPASSAWGCSHNTGIAFEEADETPFASICAEDQGAIWLNTLTRGMDKSGVKISNENTTNGGGGEAMGGQSGSYSQLAKFVNSTNYIFAWQSRGSVNLKANDWMGAGYTATNNRTNGRRVAIAMFSDKQTKIGAQASSTVGAASGDDQINWVTPSIGPDRSNVHTAVFDDTYALVSWEEIADPQCEFVAMGCGGTFTGTYFQLVDKTGTVVGAPVKSMDVYVAGDMVTMADGRVCWPYVDMAWSLAGAGYAGVEGQSNATSMSFACVSLV